MPNAPPLRMYAIRVVGVREEVHLWTPQAHQVVVGHGEPDAAAIAVVDRPPLTLYIPEGMPPLWTLAGVVS